MYATTDKIPSTTITITSSARENPRNNRFFTHMTVLADAANSSRLVTFVTADTLEKTLIQKYKT